ncbi:unnamed protein product, partial [Linum tenue]
MSLSVLNATVQDYQTACCQEEEKWKKKRELQPNI